MKVKEKIRKKSDIKEKIPETKRLGQNVHNQEVNLKEKGITLVALVVTIIILLILAGVTIATVTGDNGLFRKAREAVNAYKDSEANESQSLDYIAGQLGDLSKYDYNGYARSTMEMTVSDGTYYLPEGFKLATDSGTTINEGIVVEDKNGNQWVWIPCYVDGGKGAKNAASTGLNKYDRYAIFEYDNLETYFTEALDTNDQESIRQYGGYYIGRYETGDGTVTSLETPRLRTSSDKGNSQTNTVTIKKGQAPYNYVTPSECVTLSNGIAKANNYDTNKMYTKLCSSYAWDTALKFIGGEYATNSTQGNYKDTTFSYKDITGVNQTKSNGDSVLLPTGQTTAVKNIYDMGGNVWDYTSESCSREGYHFVGRGGRYNGEASGNPAGSRIGSDGTAYDGNGFRCTLYLK